MRQAVQVFAVVIVVGLALLVINGYSFSPTGRVVSEWTVDSAVQQLPAVQQEYNKNIALVPPFIKTVFGNERINLTITKASGEAVRISIVTEQGVIDTLSTGLLDSYTMDVQVSEQTINTISSSDDQVARLRKALDDKEITYTARTFSASVKTGLSKFFLVILDWFS